MTRTDTQGPGNATPRISATGLGRRLEDGRWLWRELSFELKVGEHLGLTGPSGCGKSSLLRVIAGLDPLDEGELRLDGLPLSGPGMPAWRAQVAWLHQQPVMTSGAVLDALRRPFALRVWHERRFDDTRIREALRGLGRDPDSLLATPTENLSGGEAQIVALLRVLQFDPPTLLLDEPTASLDPAAAEAVERLLGDWRVGDHLRSSIRVSHDAGDIQRFTTRQMSLPAPAVAEGVT